MAACESGGFQMSLLVNGTAGDDTITASGVMATVNGTALTTTSSTFLIFGDAGNDVVGLVAGAGATVDGGAGDDTIVSGFDTASIVGGSGDDLIGLFGTTNTTTVDAGSGDDTVGGVLTALSSASIEGGSGHDFISIAGPGVATISGGSGDDFISGPSGTGGDLLLGGNGKDEILGNDGDDTIDGGNGKDTLEGGPGSDLVDGGNGKDLLIGGASDGGSSANTDTFTGGRGKDTFVFKFGVTVENDLITSSAENLIITDAQKKETLVFDSGGDTDVDSLAELDALVTVSDDGTDVFVEFPHTGGTVAITLEGLGESSSVIDSLEDLSKVLKLEFA